MKKFLPLLVLVGACAPDIAQEGLPPASISVVFDLNTKVVPLPNDLAKDPTTGKIVVPPSTTDTAAQKEFYEKYVGNLDGFPFEYSATVSFTGDLKPESVSTNTVRVFDITNPAAMAVVDNLQPFYEAASKSIVIPPPNGAWTRGHTYVAAIVGGRNAGLRGAADQDVIGSQSWALVSGKTPLITCTDAKNLDTCTLMVDVIPSTKTDPVEKLRDQKASALQLEQVRLGYSKILDGLEASGLPRANVPQIWTFSIIDSAEVTFDPATNVIPFPNDVLRNPVTGKVNLPNPKTNKPMAASDCPSTELQVNSVCELNQLDGFSTLVAPISETSDKGGAVLQGTLADGALNTTNIGLLPLKPGAPTEIRTKPQYTPCLNCLSSKDANGNPQTSPQQLQWKLNAPLDEKTTYTAYITTDVKDVEKGRTVIPSGTFALVRSSAPLVENGKAAVAIRHPNGQPITFEEASLLEQLRVAYKPMFDALETLTIHRENLALAWPFTTQSESTLLETLAAYPASKGLSAMPDFPLKLVDASTPYFAAMDAGSIPRTAVGKIFAGAIASPVRETGPGGVADDTNPAIVPVQFLMSVPATAAPVGGYPVTIFSHGITGNHTNILAFMNAASGAGQILISIDTYLHGERSSCTGAKAAVSPALASDDYLCADPTTMQCDEGKLQGLCVLRSGTRDACNPGLQGDGACALAGQGRCAADSKCQGAGADFARDALGAPKISGWNIFNLADFGATRDNITQQVVDLAQLVRNLKGTSGTSFANQLALANGGALAYDTTKINFLGQSLGGIQGALFNAVSPDTHNVVLNVAGGGLIGALFVNTPEPTLAAERAALFQGFAAQGINVGTPAFDQLLGVAQWLLDPADPANVGYRLTHSVTSAGGVAPPADRKAFLQFIEGDQFVVNQSNLVLVAAANRSFSPVPPSFGCVAPLTCYEFTEKGDDFNATTATPDTRHPFLLKPPSGTAGLTLTGKAQTQAATFLATGALP